MRQRYDEVEKAAEEESWTTPGVQLPMRWIILMGLAYVSLPHSYKVQSPHRTSGTCRRSNNSKHRPIPFHHQGSDSN